MKIATHEAAVDIVHRCVERCGLCLELIGLARLRVSQVHGCDERADAHFLSLIDADFPLEKLVLVADWRNAGAELQPQEQAVLAWAEALVHPDPTPVPDALYQEVFAMLGHEELVGLSLAIALENALSRPRPRSPPGRPSFATAPPRKDPTMTTLAPLATPSAGLLAPYSGSEMLALYTTTVAVSGGAARHARASGRAVSEDGNLDLVLRQPRELGGSGGGTNPEQLFAAGFAACFHGAMTMVAIARKMQLPRDIDIAATVTFGRDPADGLFLITADLAVSLPAMDAGDAAVLVAETEKVCPYAKMARVGMQSTIRLV